MAHQDNQKEEWEGETPEVVKEEANDKPAGRNLWITIGIAIVLLAIIYFIFFDNNLSY